MMGSVIIHAQEVNVNFTVKLNGKFKPDSLYILFYQSTRIVDGNPMPPPDKTLAVPGLTTSFKIYPGAYSLGVLAQGYISLKSQIIIPPKLEDYKIEATLYPLVMGWGGIDDPSKIKTVTVKMNLPEKEKEIPLVKRGNVWKLEDKSDFPTVMYSFYVNGQETVDLLNKKVTAIAPWIAIKNIYNHNQVEFDPSLYSLEYKKAELNVPWTELQEQFLKMVNEFNQHENELLSKDEKPFNLPKAEQKAIWDSSFITLSAMASKYSPVLSQFLIEDVMLANLLRVYLLEEQPGRRVETGKNNPSDSKPLSEQFHDYFKINLKLTKELDPNSFLLEGSFFTPLMTMQMYLESHPELATRYNLPKDYFYQFIEEFTKKSSNEKLCCQLLLGLASAMQNKDELKTRALVDQIKTGYNYTKYFDENNLSRLLAGYTIRLGKLAPDFKIETLNGKSLTLADYSGKFVFIDFWGSWCVPCLKEIPHLKKLYSSLSRDQFEIIGLAKDEDAKLRKCILEQNIEYPNALASSELLAKYNVSRYPTSFLINPKGKIVRMNIRGEDEMELIREEIEEYYK